MLIWKGVNRIGCDEVYGAACGHFSLLVFSGQYITHLAVQNISIDDYIRLLSYMTIYTREDLSQRHARPTFHYHDTNILHDQCLPIQPLPKCAFDEPHTL